MADKILHKRSLNSGSIPTTASLDVGELAINVNDGKIFVRQSGSSIDRIIPLVSTEIINTDPIIGIFSGSLVGTSSWSVTASYALTAAYAETSGNNITAAYNNLREIITGSFDIDGTKTVELQKFADTDLDIITLDITTKPSGTNYYTNDLLSFQISGNLSNKICIYISAPAYSSEDKYKIIAVKEIGSF